MNSRRHIAASEAQGVSAQTRPLIDRPERTLGRSAGMSALPPKTGIVELHRVQTSAQIYSTSHLTAVPHCHYDISCAPTLWWFSQGCSEPNADLFRGAA
jgi:hypothetical protein